jgi:hypothetical protein
MNDESMMDGLVSSNSVETWGARVLNKPELQARAAPLSIPAKRDASLFLILALWFGLFFDVKKKEDEIDPLWQCMCIGGSSSPLSAQHRQLYHGTWQIISEPTLAIRREWRE